MSQKNSYINYSAAGFIGAALSTVESGAKVVGLTIKFVL